MKFGSLFSGIGGFDLGFEQAGLSCSWQVEVDADCGRVLSRQWPNVTRHKDVRDIGKLESVDVICGGFPCQDLSVAGKRKGLAGERSGLWFEFLRIIGLNRPRWIVIENVPGLLSSDEGRDFAVILRGLVECGYCLAWRIVDAQFYGVAQRRRRVFIVGSLGDGSSAQILFESESVSWNPPTRGEAGPGVAPTVRGGTASGSNEFGNKISVLPVNGGADASEDGTGRGTPLVVANCFNGYTGGADDNDAQGNHLIAAFEPHHDEHEGRGANFKQTHVNPSLRGPNGTDNTLIAFSSKDHGADAGQIAPTLRSQNFKDSHMNGGGQVAIAFSAGQGSKARSVAASVEHTPPLKAAESGSNKVPSVSGQFGVRRLTPRECERLQGFHDDWTLYDANGREISDSARYRMLGNAVAVPVARWIGERILKIGNK